MNLGTDDTMENRPSMSNGTVSDKKTILEPRADWKLLLRMVIREVEIDRGMMLTGSRPHQAPEIL